MILLLDNYDSFVHNLARFLRRQGCVTQVVRSDAIEVGAIGRLQPQAIVLSPGPHQPLQAGCCLEVVRTWGSSIPLLGVCLGHQTIGAAFGGEVVRCEPAHGRSSSIAHDGDGLFAGLPQPLAVGRYHSLALASDSLPPSLRVTARSEDGTIMGIAHRRWPIYGVQFHPESVLTPQGGQLLANFCRLAAVGQIKAVL